MKTPFQLGMVSEQIKTRMKSMSKTFYCGYCNRHKKIEILAKEKPRQMCSTCKTIRDGLQ